MFCQFLYLWVVVVPGEWKCERKGHARVKKEWKITLKVLKMSGKLMAVGFLFPPKSPNSETLLRRFHVRGVGMNYLAVYCNVKYEFIIFREEKCNRATH